MHSSRSRLWSWSVRRLESLLRVSQPAKKVYCEPLYSLFSVYKFSSVLYNYSDNVTIVFSSTLG